MSSHEKRVTWMLWLDYDTATFCLATEPPDDIYLYDNPSYVPCQDDVPVCVPGREVSSSSPPSSDHDKIMEQLDDGINVRCGYRKLKPRWLQIFNKMPVFVLWVFILCFLEGFAVNGITSAALPSIERQFKLTSTKSALIPSSQNIGALIIVLFVSFIGERYHKPVIIATGAIIMAFGSFIFIIPHLSLPYTYGALTSSNTIICPARSDVDSTPPSCESDEQKYLGVFMLAQIVHGVGFTPVFTLGTVYIDENVDHSLAAIYVGLIYAATAIGVAMGFFFGGQLSEKVFVDFDRIDQDSLGFNARDPRWIGAWWVGFLISIVGFVLIAIPIYGYPKHMPEGFIHGIACLTAFCRRRNCYNYDVIMVTCAMSFTVSSMPLLSGFHPGVASGSEEVKDKRTMQYMKEMTILFFKTIVQLVQNPVYLFVNLGGCACTFLASGTFAFSFKLLIEQYNLNFDTAGFIIGGFTLAGASGMVLGGALVRIFRLDILGMTRLNTSVTLLSAICGISFLAGCPNVNLVGLEVPYSKNSTINGYIDTCQGACDCATQAYSPVCGHDNNVYFSACHAGCTTQASVAMMTTYENCSCVTSQLNASATHENAIAAKGRCEDNCTNIIVIAPFMVIAILAIFTPTTTTIMSTLRSVEENQRAFAIGLHWIFIRLLGMIPGAVVVGAVLDSTCEVWAKAQCDSSEFCMMYRLEKMSTRLMTWWFIVSLCAAIFFLVASIFASRNKQKIHLDTN